MKFHASGPDIPDKLIWERDAGDVVFICGAGVSRAKADMPDFPSLASQVLDELLVPEESKARRVLELALKDDNIGLVPIDKVFGELERVYSISDVETAVSKALSAPKNANTECHEIIRDLATTPHGAIRLVTTNFDNLFSRITDQQEWVYPNLPTFERTSTFSGLAYLHGKSGDLSDRASSNFVLSTQSFGRAYMAEGWANEFLKNVLKQHTVVFVGYSADDPPMQYLLEALANTDTTQRKVYAFQQGDQVPANEKWVHRGVIPIAFEKYDDLWTTLELWRDRAVDLDGWIDEKLEMAMAGPTELADWERSQVSHLASSRIGVKALADRKQVIPAQWLFCFDSSFRYATPSKRYTPDAEINTRDPFSILGLVADPKPKPISSDDPYSDRPTPSDVWDAFRTTQDDMLETNEERSFAFLRGPSSSNASELSPRLFHLAVWISKIANSPVAVRWAAYQTGLHPEVRRLVFWALEREETRAVPLIEEAWEILFEAWESVPNDQEHNLYRLQKRIAQSGWSETRVRQYQRANASRINIQSFRRAETIFADTTAIEKLSDLVEVQFKVPEDRVDINVPDEWLEPILRADRLNLNLAIEFKKQIGLYEFSSFPPILQSEDADISSFDRTYGINAPAFRYLRRLQRLVELNQDNAVAEIKTWPLEDTNIFGRFRIWSAGNDKLLTSKEAGEVFLNLSQRVFWGSRHQRDLLYALKSRWAKLPLSATRQIEKRIVNGDDTWVGEEQPKYFERRAWQSANMLQWLKENGCSFNLNFDATIANFKQASPTWDHEYGSKAADSLESRGGSVRTIKDHSILDDVPLWEIVDVASANMGRGDNFLEEADPFGGICIDKPVKAIAALRRKAQLGEYPEWAWSRWLRRDEEDAWSDRILTFTTALLCSASEEQLVELKYSVYRWFEKVSGHYPDQVLGLREQLFQKLMETLRHTPEMASSALVRRKHEEIDWVSEAINSPAGQLAAGLFDYQETKDLPDGAEIPINWLRAASALLELDGDNGRFALICFMQQLPWLFYRVPDWTGEQLLSAVRDDDVLTVDAYWSGLAYGTRRTPSDALFLIIKNDLLEKFSRPISVVRTTEKNLSLLVLVGWLNRSNGERWVTDSEFAAVLMAGTNDLRENILWQLWRWSSKDDGESSINWDIELAHFFQKVWPRTLAAKSAGASERMLEILFEDADRLIQLSPIILPRLAKLKRGSLALYRVSEKDSGIIQKHPSVVISVLSVVLADEPSEWPYDIGKTLEALAEVSPEVAEDDRLIDLKTRWARR